MQKKIFVILLLLSSNSFSAGKYDGIWAVKYNFFDIGYAVVNENNGSVIITYMQLDSSFFIPLTVVIQGTINDKIFSGNAIAGSLSYSLEGEFNDDGLTGSYTQTYCKPRTSNVFCLLNDGTSVSIQKVF